MTEFGELSAAVGMTISASTYDGDTPAPIRSAIRAAGQVVVTNPDMLHSAILPHHTKWFQLFEQLRVIVIDELHTYRGVFGGHVANVLRRLLRICAHYGSHPVIVCCSATIGNPAELATMLTGRPMRLDRPERRPVRRAARPPRGPAGPPSGERRAGLGRDPRPALGPAVPARRAPDDRLRAVAGRGRDPAHRPARVAARALRAAQPDPRLSRRLPAHGAAGDRARAARRRDPRRRRAPTPSSSASTSAASTCRSWPATRARSRRPGSRSAGPDGGRARASRCSSPPAAPVDQYVIHHPEFLLDGHAGGGPARSGQPARPARPPARGDVRAAVRARRGVRARPRRRPAGVPRRGGARPPGERRPLVLGERELPGLGDLAAHGRAGERRDHRHDAGPPAGARRGRPVQRAGPRPRAGDLHPRVGPVLRRPPRMARAQGLRPSRRRRPLHVREPRGDAQAARGVRRRRRRPAGGGSTAR